MLQCLDTSDLMSSYGPIVILKNFLNIANIIPRF